MVTPREVPVEAVPKVKKEQQIQVVSNEQLINIKLDQILTILNTPKA